MINFLMINAWYHNNGKLSYNQCLVSHNNGNFLMIVYYYYYELLSHYKKLWKSCEKVFHFYKKVSRYCEK